MVFFWTADYSKYSQRQPKELGHHPNHLIQLGHHPNHHFSFLYIFLNIYYNWYILSRMVHITIYCKDVLVSSNFNKMYWTAANWAKKMYWTAVYTGGEEEGLVPWERRVCLALPPCLSSKHLRPCLVPLVSCRSREDEMNQISCSCFLQIVATVFYT